MKRQATLTLCLLGLAVFTGCGPPHPQPEPEYQTLGKDPRRDTDRAKSLNAQAAELIKKGDLTQAQKLLKEALTADLMYGPAHNNLGKIYYAHGSLYLAAWEFTYASKLMQHQPEPRNNLGLVFEASGKLDEAIQEYTQAVKLEPENAQFIGNQARARIRRGDKSPEVRTLLQQLVLHDNRPDWVEWARDRLGLMKFAPDAPTTREH